MKKTKTYRGFAYTAFIDLYGSECSLQKSSLATEDAIWLGVNDPNPQIMASVAPDYGIETTETTGWVSFPIPADVSINTRMHLNRAQVKKLLPFLQRFAATGKF